MDLEEGGIVMCTVDRIVGTVVFVKIDGDGEGSIILSEIAPGRIRNIRDYVVPKKKIVCKILNIDKSGNIHLSLRRVTQKDQKEIKQEYEQEKNCISILKGILGQKSEEIIKEILKTGKVYEFLEKTKENPEKLEKLAGKDNSKRIIDILMAQKQKKVIIKKEIHLTTLESNGLELIKDVFKDAEEGSVKYLSAGRYVIQKESNDPKLADNYLRTMIVKIEERAKKNKLDFSVKEK
ncbi:MAG: S1 RNA-binding domain-containing protein [Nanoarchaeota archaeon]